MQPQATSTEENYLKAILRLSSAERGNGGHAVTTNALAAALNTTPASVTDMVKRLNEKGLLTHIPYKGVILTSEGRKLALDTLRKHRLWEVFLVEKLGFKWDEVHDMAEQLEHIHSPQLVEALDAFLGHPKFDPHGDPIPDADGRMASRQTENLSVTETGVSVVVAGLVHTSPDFLRYLDRLGLRIGEELTVLEHIDFDASRLVQVGRKGGDTRELLLSRAVTENLLVSRT